MQQTDGNPVYEKMRAASVGWRVNICYWTALPGQISCSTWLQSRGRRRVHGLRSAGQQQQQRAQRRADIDGALRHQSGGL